MAGRARAAGAWRLPARMVGVHHLPNGASALFPPCTELLAEFETGLARSLRLRPRAVQRRERRRISASPDLDDGCGVLLVTGGVERRDQVIRPIKFILLQRHDARGGCRIVWRRTAAVELEHGVGFVDRDDDPDGLRKRPVRA